MLNSFNFVKYSISAIVIGLLIQHLKYILISVEARSNTENNSFREQHSSHPQALAYGRNHGNDYKQSGQQRGRYSIVTNTSTHRSSYAPQRIVAGTGQWQEGTQNDPRLQDEIECSNKELHRNLIFVPTEAKDKYSYISVKSEDKSRKTTAIEVCCKGYGPQRWRGQTKCVPVCDNCRNGRCVAPNVCECYEEFVQNDNGDCVFTCPISCQNGRCYLDGSCECDPGYKLDESRKFCRPICSNGCGSSLLYNCTAPEVCGCIQGLTLREGVCKPVCQPDCGVGGECDRFNRCNCLQGYRLKDGVCQSDCYQACDNGSCYSRNRCICNPGFVYHERTKNCVPL